MRDGSTIRTHSLPVFKFDFPADAHAATLDAELQAAVDNAVVKKDTARKETLTQLPDADGLRTLAGDIKRHTLDNLDYYLELLEQNVKANGGKVYYAAEAEDANRIVVEIAKAAKIKLVVKSKSMVSEETELNHAFGEAGIEVLETDLGELIIQLDNDHPSHIVMPIIHKRAADVGRTFERVFKVPFTDDPQKLAEMARVYLRGRFAEADMGVSGVNFAVAETGSICLCTNEGNGRMCTSRPRVHVALMGMEKLIPAMADLPVFLKLLARSASGQSLTQYTNIVTGPKRAGELDGPEEFHLVIMDNGRSRVLSTEYSDVLKCIRCGACLNACPIYRKVGGHAYGSVYPGPIGALITPLFNGLAEHKHLPHASSLCGACYEACPVKINIPEILIALREEQHKAGISTWSERMVFKLWTIALLSPALYAVGQRMQQFVLRKVFRGKGGFVSRLPGPAKGWTDVRDFPQPAAKSFRDLWKARQQGGK